MSFHTADLCDDYRDELKLADPLFNQFGKKRNFSGPIVTVKVFEDNVLVKKALETIPSGSVLVVDGGASRRCALMGDNLAEIAVKRKLAGVIINGCIRDSGEINEMDIGVFALGTNPFKSIKEGKGYENLSVQFAGVDWSPGQYVYADEDGILLAERKLI
ncbi:ribonuclease E activity regulator RraA [Desertibacillus haloalkaliphilus]|uniref:ribonuclease E activity regulator RraA n=1 Tax=Desertibacillus haloalkaliphilus TaxID=1328930 RepID=UPI001C25BBB8|nr:ribonuclease E activity regulator RraA [Desertibacillus haloalkaliphilus]MBU8906771.1 ribonuclease E activity regulator RraA [Desertibacillus haloalkaliphilus]